MNKVNTLAFLCQCKQHIANMPTQRITLGEWMPDQSGISGALTDAKNVVSQAIGYGPFPSAVAFSGTAAEELVTLYAAKNPDSTTQLFTSGNTKIYTVDGVGALTLVKSGMTTGISDKVRFTQFGKTVITTNNADKLQAWTLGSSTSFADLDASAPIAKYITVVRDFVVVANTYESAEQKQYRVRWSAINDETDWTEDVNTQSDYQDIPDGGQIVGIRGGEFGLVFLERAISRMTYVGTPFIFQFDNISRNKGCMVAGSIAQYQGITFFLSDDGFYLCDGQTIQPIGSEKVDRFFIEDASESDYGSMSAAVDPVRKLVIWNYVAIDGNRKLIIYNFATKKWTYADAGTDYLSEASTASVTLEQLDSINSSIDALTTSLDSRLYIGGKYFLGGTLGAKVYTYTGANLTGQISTGDIDLGGVSVVTLARPQVDNGSATIAVASRALLNQSVNYGTAVAADSENRVSLRSSGRYHRLQLVPTGADWKNAVAIDVDVVGQGVR
jgi:hypothetical protein